MDDTEGDRTGRDRPCPERHRSHYIFPSLWRKLDRLPFYPEGQADQRRGLPDRDSATAWVFDVE